MTTVESQVALMEMSPEREQAIKDTIFGFLPGVGEAYHPAGVTFYPERMGVRQLSADGLRYPVYICSRDHGRAVNKTDVSIDPADGRVQVFARYPRSSGSSSEWIHITLGGNGAFESLETIGEDHHIYSDFNVFLLKENMAVHSEDVGKVFDGRSIKYLVLTPDTYRLSHAPIPAYVMT